MAVGDLITKAWSLIYRAHGENDFFISVVSEFPAVGNVDTYAHKHTHTHTQLRSLCQTLCLS